MKQCALLLLAGCAAAQGMPFNARGADAQSASPLTRSTNLWARGERIRFFVTSSLGGRDTRVSQAIRHWEDKTCFRFEECRSESSCTRPYLRFVNGNGCSSPVGKTYQGVNTITLGRGCEFGAAVHEIGHSLGLSHEQSRKDRDTFVTVDLSQVRRGMENNFERNRAGHDMGKYDYGSIMHYSNSGFAVGRRPTIIAPQPIGQRNGLSAGDVAGIEFLYNDCSSYFRRPRCMASRDASRVQTVKVGEVFEVDFNMIYEPRSNVRVTYDGTTAPSSSVRYAVSSGRSVRDMSPANVRFTPSRSLNGKRVVLSATFTASNGQSATCEVHVNVGTGSGTPVAPAPRPTTRPTTRPVPTPRPRPTTRFTRQPNPYTRAPLRPRSTPAPRPTSCPCRYYYFGRCWSRSC